MDVTVQPEEIVSELIHRRRRQILVHSILYYRMNETLIADATFDRWAHELAVLQQQHLEISEGVDYMREAFRAFSGDTGFDLPLEDTRANEVARELLRYSLENHR